MTRPRGRHAAPSGGPAPSWIAPVAAALAPARAWLSPRLAATGAWLFERRLHVFVIGSGVATAALVGGSVAMLQLTVPSPGDEASVVVSTPRPTSSDPASPSAFGPILPSPAPGSPFTPATPGPSVPPVDEAAEPPADGGPATEPAPEPSEEPRRDTAPGATNRPDKPRD